MKVVDKCIDGIDSLRWSIKSRIELQAINIYDEIAIYYDQEREYLNKEKSCRKFLCKSFATVMSTRKK